MPALGELLLDLGATGRTGLRGFEFPCGCLQILPTSFHDFVGDFLKQRRRSGVKDLSIQCGLLPDVLARLFERTGRRGCHVLDAELLARKYRASPRQSCRELVLEVVPLARDLGPKAAARTAGVLPVLRAAALGADRSIERDQAILCLLKPARVLDVLAHLLARAVGANNRQQAADAPVGAHGMLLLCLALDIHVRALDGHRDAPLAVLVHELAAFDRAAGARLAAQLDVTDALQT